MGIAKNGYYTKKDIDSKNCEWNIVYGERSPGKSYDIKKDGLRRAWETGKACLALIRREKVDIETVQVEGYFQDRGSNVVSDVTNGEYTFIQYYRKKLYFARVEENSGKVIRGMCCGEVFALSTSHHYKSTGHPHINYVIFEEFITDRGYLPDEPLLLQNLLSTILRKDDDVKIYLIGNTISRVCPYFLEWGLKNIRKQKPGTIDIYHHENTEGDIISIAVEYCPPSPHKSKLFFGRAAKSIQGGAWQTGSYPRIPDEYEKFECVYMLTYHSRDDFRFTVQLLVHTEDCYTIVYIYPAKHTCERVISGAFSVDILTTPQLDMNLPGEQMIRELFFKNKVCYSDNQTAQDFNDSIKAELHNPFI